MTQPAASEEQLLPPDDPLHPDAVARRRRHAEDLARARGIVPLSPHRLNTLGTGGPWESDEEFDAWLAEITTARHRDTA